MNLRPLSWLLELCLVYAFTIARDFYKIESSERLTSIHRACFSAQTSIDLRRATLGTSVTGSVSTVPVDGHRFRPPVSHLSMYRLSYLHRTHWHLCRGLSRCIRPCQARRA